MASIIKAVVTLPFVTGLPRDCTQNVFHWLAPDDPTSGDLANIGDEIVAFYNQSLTGDPESSIGGYLSPIVSRGENACHIDFYDAQADPQVPLLGASFTLVDMHEGGALAMVNEMAVCLSITATPALPVLKRNRRGRLYIGPLNTAILGDREVGGVDYPAVNTEFRTRAAAICDRMADTLIGSTWAVYSRTLDQAFQVSGGWVDNDFDTQRRRELDPSLRTSWGINYAS